MDAIAQRDRYGDAVTKLKKVAPELAGGFPHDNGQPLCNSSVTLVAGEGFEPSTFGL